MTKDRKVSGRMFDKLGVSSFPSGRGGGADVRGFEGGVRRGQANARAGKVRCNT